MSGEPLLVTVETAAGSPSSFPLVLKKIMEMPPPNILDGDDGKRRADEEEEAGVGSKTSSPE